MQPPVQEISAIQMAAREVLWRQGQLRWKLHAAQKDIYDSFYATKGKRFVICCSRRLGKSFLLCLLSIETAIRNPDSDIFYISPTKTQVKRVIEKLFRKILLDCPEDLRPVWHSQDKVFQFPNGSTVHMGAIDSGRADAIRGSDAALGIVDEAGFANSAYVEDLVNGILRPMTLLTKSPIIIASTPAKTPRHSFQKFYEQAQLEGCAVHKTVWDNPLLTKEDIEEEMAASGGENSTVWKREFLGQFCVDEEIITFPEFSLERQEQLVKAVERPPYFDCYVSIDVGMKDATALIFLYYDFRAAQIVVEGEGLLQGIKEVRSDLIADLIKTKEKELWGEKKPYFRLRDYDAGSAIMANELDQHGLQFVAGEKDGVEAGVNEIRLLIKNNLLIINPSCVNLISQLSACVWNNARTSFDRIDGYGHFDLCAALIIAVRNIRRSRNPYPSDKYYTDSQFFYDQPSSKTNAAKAFEQLFKVRKPD